MKAAVLINNLARGGAERQALHAVTHLNRLGCATTLIAYQQAEQEYPIPPDMLEHYKLLPKHRSRLGFLRRLRGYLAAEQFDLVHAFKGAENFYGVLAGAAARRPVVVGGYRVEFREGRHLCRGFRLLDRWVDGWIVNAEVIARSMHGMTGIGRNRFHIVPNGVDVDAVTSSLTPGEAKSRLNLDPQVPVVSMIARLRPQKNHGLLLQAAQDLGSRRPVQFLIVGDGPLHDTIAGDIAAQDLGGTVRMLGDRSDIATILAATDVSVLTSHFEGLSNVVLESMAAGVPLVLTAFDGVETAVRDGREGFVVPQASVAPLVAAVERLLDDAALRATMGSHGRSTVGERFGMEAMARRLLAVYEQLYAASRTAK